jgi:catechol 2,3-dioxygenase
MSNRFALGHVHLKVRNLNDSIEFYTDLLGLKITERTGHYLFLTYGSRHHEVALQEIGPEAEPSKKESVGLYHFAIELPELLDLKSLHRRLQSANVAVRSVNHGISKVLYFNDPDGNGVEAYVDTRACSGRFEWQGQSVPLDMDRLPGFR